MGQNMLPIEGISLLDLAAHGPGAYGTMILGDLGAEIIRIVAPPSSGARQPARKASKRSVLHKAVHRNKKSMMLNLKDEDGRRIFYQLAAKADVIVEGFRPGVTERLAIDYRTISEMNPRIIYCSITGYGQDGPYRELPGHDINYLSFGGALDLIGQAGMKPSIPLNFIADYGAGGKDAVIGIMAALLAREKTGRGQHVDISMTDGVISLLTEVAMSQFLDSGEVPRRGEHMLGGADPLYDCYETNDGKFISLACLEPNMWRNMCQLMNREDLAQFDVMYKYVDSAEKYRKHKEIASCLTIFFLSRSRDESFELLASKDVPVGKVYSLDETVSDPQVAHRNMIVEFTHATVGKVRQAGIAIKLSDTPGKIRTLPPEQGEHTDEILAGLGYNMPRVNELRDKGVVA